MTGLYCTRRCRRPYDAYGVCQGAARLPAAKPSDFIAAHAGLPQTNMGTLIGGHQS
jgi:hypothetical protein